jgi:hypothetical protein
MTANSVFNFALDFARDFILEGKVFDPAFLRKRDPREPFDAWFTKEMKRIFSVSIAVNCPLSYPREQSSA